MKKSDSASADLSVRFFKIQQQTNQDIKQIIQTAIDLYYQKNQQSENDPLALLKKSDFIACGEGDPDFSSTYKTQLKTMLNEL